MSKWKILFSSIQETFSSSKDARKDVFKKQFIQNDLLTIHFQDAISCNNYNDSEHCLKKDSDERKPTPSFKNDDKMNDYGVIKSNKTGPALMPAPIRNEKINMNFDHLSVVSEECVSNSDDQMNRNSKSENKPSGDPIYTNFQSTIPPLKHFENLSYEDIGPNIGEKYLC